MDREEILSYFHESWHDLANVYMKKLLKNVAKEPYFPDKSVIFRVFSMPLEDIKIVILGQDPYHGPGQATGLSFDCNVNANMQPSVRNMFKELVSEFPERNYRFKNGSLERWFNEENIFLLNTALTVEPRNPGSHTDRWKDFTDATIQYIADYNENCLFLLMGLPAQKKAEYISDKNRIVSCVHPSPMSANRGFFGSKVFKKIEEKLGQQINWAN